MQFLDDSGREVEVVGIQRPISLCRIYSRQLKRCMCKGFQLFAMIVNDLELGESREVSLKDHPILRDFVDTFPSDILRMPPKHDIDFRIDLVPGEKHIS